MSTARYRLLNLVLVLALFAGSAWAYPRLPARIPMHFDLSGRPDRWEARSLVSWFLLPMIAAALALFMRWIADVGARSPHTWNLPEKRRFLALDPRAQAPIVARMQRFLALVSAMVTTLLGLIQVAVYQTATGRENEPPAWMLGAVGLFVVVILVSAARLNGTVGQMVRDASADAGT